MAKLKNSHHYVITCGDEGVQINEGTRLAFVGSGFRLDGFSKVVPVLKDLLKEQISVVSQEENSWVKEQLDLQNWRQIDVMSQQHTEALADREGLDYVGHLTFTDPKHLKNEIKGHMVRPHNIHIANKICFTLGGGEQTYNLGQYLISAEWVASVPKKVATQVIQTQVAYYEKLAGRKLEFIFEEEGDLDKKLVAKNKKVLEKILA